MLIDYVNLKPKRRSVWRAISRWTYVVLCVGALVGYVLNVRGVW